MSTQDTDLALAGLTEEERKMLAELEADGEDNRTQGELEEAEGKATTNKGDDEPNDENQGGTDDGAAAAAGDAGAAAASANGGQAAAPTADEPGAAPGIQAQQAPILVARAPENVEALLRDIADKKAELRTKYDDGDMTFADYEQQKEALDEQRMELRLQVETANTAAKLELQRQQNQWNADCGTFLDSHPEYAGEANKDAFEHLNETIIAFAKMPRNASLTGPQLLDKAHKAVQAERGTPVAEAKPEAAKPAPRAPIPKPATVPSLGKVPAAAGTEAGEGRFAHLEKLNGFELERALAKMSDSDREAFMKETA